MRQKMNEVSFELDLSRYFLVQSSTEQKIILLKYRGPILRVTWPALGSDDLNFDQSGTSIQILPEPNAGHVPRFFIELQL